MDAFELLTTSLVAMSTDEVARALGITPRDAKARLRHLQRRGRVDCVSSNRGLLWFVNPQSPTRWVP